MTRPMTGQPTTTEELTNAVQRANESMNENEKSDEEKLEELRQFKENNQDLYDELEEAVEEAKAGETKMVVEENGEAAVYTRDEWRNERGARLRMWDRLDRNGGSYVRVAHWFSDEDVNAVKVGDGFYGEKKGETEKAYKFVCEANSQNHTAESRTLWIPKKAARVHTLE